MSTKPQGVPSRDGPPDHTTGLGSIDPKPVCFQGPQRKVVLDTNVLVSLYVFADSRFAPLRARIECGEWQAYSDAPCLDEFRRVLGYPLFALTEERQEAARAAYESKVIPLDGARPGPLVSLPRCRDRDDQKFLELARDAGADYLVTADKDLLRLARRDRLRGIFRILTPEAALTAA
ncbi:putative toxin-antitoxin system toxin component, PIN family [Sulfuritalea sp.]|uniref:putative toxin-antitoxin system toxin component, PIN family n=1 Tax=Sulfuritalea sp. TaxID=2480090 RepID=UPI001AC6CBC9|nr:putative toxin-antitoxin system toxin component, PIN family [Sulfuritalea sp.]MBN8475149.1 putative toxin-antitoxin system toxin component, PIN family [Sulfuritalea sp.]